MLHSNTLHSKSVRYLGIQTELSVCFDFESAAEIAGDV